MKRPLQSKTVLALSFVLACADAAACANDQDAPGAPLPTGDVDASRGDLDSSTATEDQDSGPPDAGVDATARTCTDEGWCHTVVPDAQTLVSVWGDGTGNVWVVSKEGSILRWDGAAWTESYKTSPATQFYAVWGTSPTDLWAGNASGLLHGTGASANSITWTEVALPSMNFPWSIRTLEAAGDKDLWAIGYIDRLSYVLHRSEASIARASSTGSEWEVDAELQALMPDKSGAIASVWQGVWGTAGDDVWAGATGATLFHRDAQGWHPISTAPDVVSDFTFDFKGYSIDRTRVFLGASGHGGQLSDGTYVVGTSADNGATYTWAERPFDSPTSFYGLFPGGDIQAVWASNSGDIWVAGPKGFLVELEDWDASTWRTAATSIDQLPTYHPIYDLWGTGPDDLWAVGEGIALHKTTPGAHP